MKKALKKMLSGFGLEIRNIEKSIDVDLNYGINLLELVVRDAAARAGRKLRLLQVGANDGIREDPVRPLINAELVEAVLVEPLPELVGLLNKQYHDNPNVAIVQSAVGAAKSKQKFYFGVSNTGEFLQSGVSSVMREAVERHFSTRRAMYPDYRIESIEVDVLRPDDVIAIIGWDGADVLCIDAEGFDYQIVNYCIVEGLKIPIIYFEINSIPIALMRQLIAKLDYAGYRVVRNGPDMLAMAWNRQQDMPVELAPLADTEGTL